MKFKKGYRIDSRHESDIEEVKSYGLRLKGRKMQTVDPWIRELDCSDTRHHTWKRHRKNQYKS